MPNPIRYLLTGLTISGYLGQIISPDSLLKIISWNLVLEERTEPVLLLFHKETGFPSGNKIYKLSAGYSEKQIDKDTTYHQSDWYGALYYDLKPCTVDGKQFWVLLGNDYGNPEISRKIIEVVSFSPDDSMIFGKKWFPHRGRYKLQGCI